MKQLLTALLLFFFQVVLYGQSGWTKGAREYYAKLGFSTGKTDQYYYLNGELHPGAEISHQTVAFYGEYGFTNALTGIVNFPLLRFTSFETTQTAYGVGDPQIGLKYALYKKIPVSLSLAAQLPLASTNNRVSIKDGSGLFNLPQGEGDLNFWGTLAVSQGFGKGYGSLYGAYNKRTGGFSSRMKVGAEVGWRFFDKLWVNTKMVGFNSFKDGDSSKATLFNGEGVAFSQVIVGGAYEVVKHWNITADYLTYNDVVYNRKNIYSLPTFTIGISFQNN